MRILPSVQFCASLPATDANFFNGDTSKSLYLVPLVLFGPCLAKNLLRNIQSTSAPGVKKKPIMRIGLRKMTRARLENGKEDAETSGSPVAGSIRTSYVPLSLGRGIFASLDGGAMLLDGWFCTRNEQQRSGWLNPLLNRWMVMKKKLTSQGFLQHNHNPRVIPS